MYDQIEQAIRFRRKHTMKAAPQVARYAGKGYREGWTVAVDAYENHPFELVANLLPVLAYKNPTVVCKPRTAFGSPQDALSLQAVLKQWVYDVQFARVIREALYEFCFCFGVVGITMEPVPGFEDEQPAPMRPSLKHVPGGRFFADPEALSMAEASFMGSVWVKDVDDLLEAVGPDGVPVFDTEAVKEMASDDGIRQDAEDTQRDDIFADLDIRKGQMVGYEVWCRANNTIYTLAFKRGGSKDGRFIRAPREWIGSPKYGPYHVLGAYVVPGQLFPLSPLQVTADLVDEINAHAGMLRRQAGTAKRLMVADTTTTADKVTMSPDGTVLCIPGFNKVETLEFEGPNAANVEYLAMLRERLDRQSGISNMVRGEVSGDPTATEAQLASQYHNSRVRFLQSLVQETCCEILDNVAAVMYGSEEVAIPVQQDGVSGVWAGGQWPGGAGRRESMSISIEPYSMEWMNEGLRQRQTMDAMKMVYEVAPMIPTLPWVKHQGVFNDVMESINVPNGFQRYFDPQAVDLAMQIQAVPMVRDAMTPPEPKGSGKPPPKGTKGSERAMHTQAAKA